MLVEPESYILSEFENKPYEKFIKERNKLIREIRYFEKHKEEIMNSEEALIHPDPEMHYWWNLQALGCLCKLMSDKCFDDEEQEE